MEQKTGIRIFTRDTSLSPSLRLTEQGTAGQRRERMMLAGFRSRCRTPFSCAAASPAQSCWAISIPLSLGSQPSRRKSPIEKSINDSEIIYDLVKFV
jgi:hypothetical protein